MRSETDWAGLGYLPADAEGAAASTNCSFATALPH